MEYRVLARKYRPSSFDDLIGQEVLVRTLSNAIAQGRIAHAFLLTGIRGIGKTTTARIIARALNCEKGPTIAPCGVCTHCVSITEDRHVDVIEMDAASHTGVDDVRDIIDKVAYLPLSARYKIFIIDEVHMLSKNAFNALLKTLEEPPPHVKFVFATTESRKIPVTILSRCQRFDLKRISTEMLAAHLQNICGKEQVTAEDEALKLIALAAEGSVRDALSLLDQAIARSTPVQAEDVRHMLGASDNTALFSLWEALLSGNITAALTRMRELYNAGADPMMMVQELLEITHLITRTKINPTGIAEDVTLSQQERALAKQCAESLSMPVLARLWQMLLKGVQEMKFAPQPVVALEMLLIRIAYAAELPTPAEIIKQGSVVGGQDSGVKSTPSPIPHPSSPITSFIDLIALFEKNKEPLIALTLRDQARLVSFAPGRVTLNISPPPANDFAGKVSAMLGKWTGMEWKIMLSSDAGNPSLRDQELSHRQELKQEAEKHPLVASVFDAFPGAKIVGVKG